jgi:D-3-phosphoglycerate dehydrogenase
VAELVENLILDLLDWLEYRARTYDETMSAWRTSCPRLPVWEDANDRGLVKTVLENGRVMVRVSPEGRAYFTERRSRHTAG